MLTNGTKLIWYIIQLNLLHIFIFQSTIFSFIIIIRVQKRHMDPQDQKKTEEVKENKQKQQAEEKQTSQKKQQKHQKTDKTYIKSNKKWSEFGIDQGIIEALRQQNKNKPTKVQEEALQVALDKNRKKFNLLLRAINGSGKTLAFLLPMIIALEPGLKCAEDKHVRGGKVQQNQIFRPQGIIIIQNFLLQSQLNNYLVNFKDYGENYNVDKLKFTVGVLNNDGHKFGDIIVCMPKSFLNRHARGNMKLDQCKFVAIDQIDQIYNFDKQSLSQILQIIKKQRPNLISCSATMQKHFLKFYSQCDPDYIKMNVNADIQKQTGQKITLQGVKNYSQIVQSKEGSKKQLYDFVLKVIFKQLYGGTQVNRKPQLFIFFNSVDEIYQFDKKFQAASTDFTSQESKYLQNLTRASIAARVYKDGKKVDLPHNEKEMIMNKFRNTQTNVLLCTNIMARGIDIRNAVFVINMGAPKRSDKDNDIDVDIYLHRVGRTGRHNDKGIALTIGTKQQIQKLTENVHKIHKIQIEKMTDGKQIASEVYKCIESNA